MAVHLKMDFRVVELGGNINVLQCDRGHDSCLHEVEYDNKVPGALVQAIHQMRHHTCEPADAGTKPKSAQGVLPLHAGKLNILSTG